MCSAGAMRSMCIAGATQGMCNAVQFAVGFVDSVSVLLTDQVCVSGGVLMTVVTRCTPDLRYRCCLT